MRHNATGTDTILYSSFYTELLHLLGPDHTGPVTKPGLGHLPHLAPGEGGRVKLQNRISISFSRFSRYYISLVYICENCV